MRTITPSALKPGDTIGVIAPSSYYDTNKLEKSFAMLKERGFNILCHPQIKEKHHQFAGSRQQKVNALHNTFSNPDINAIFCTCGGNGATDLLDKLDYELIKNNPKIFIGFSDITILLNAISAKTGLTTFHGPTLSRMPHIDDIWVTQMLNTLTGTQNKIDTNIVSEPTNGILWGGNLSVMQALIGTPYAPTMDNALLLLEDVNDHLSRYDRMISHMKQAGWLTKINGVILGEFLKSQDNAQRPFGMSIEEIVEYHAPNKLNSSNLPIGHGNSLCTLPIGAPIDLKNNQISFKSLA